MSAAETMRSAATAMRERAELADAGVTEWWTNGDVAEWAEKATGSRAIAMHIESWDPTMARVTADLLEAGADEFDRRAAKHGIDSLTAANPTAHALVAIATTYLHEEGS